jgi:hypothetical protein
MRILSFDCAYKTLGISYIDINENFVHDATQILQTIKKLSKNLDILSDNIEIEKTLQQLKTQLELLEALIINFVKIIYVDVVDVLHGIPLAGTTMPFRLQCLKKVLQNVDTCINFTNNPANAVVIEYQMSANDKSREVSHAIAFHYANNNVTIISPAIKMSFAIGGNTYDQVAIHHLDTYRANKEHAIINIINLFSICKININIAFAHIKRAQYKDVCDALMNSLSYLKTKKYL